MNIESRIMNNKSKVRGQNGFGIIRNSLFLIRRNPLRGFLTPQVLVFSFVATLLLSAIVTWSGNSLRDARYVTERERAFYIAESGLEYYRWHLAHAPSDFKDGTATSGPYIHPYFDASGNNIGTFELTITPPPLGSTLVTIVSKGTYASTTSSSRTLEAKLAIPSIAKYAFVANSVMRFGEGTVVFGPIHSNDGIRFDGLAHNLVTSAKASYDDPDHDDSGSEKLEFGVHTHVKPPPLTGSYTTYVAAEVPPATPAARADVFEVGRSFPVPAVGFNGFTSDLASMKTKAQTGGRYIAPSGDDGYQIIFKTNDTFDLYRVNSISNPPSRCTNTQGQTDWGTWSINTKTFIANYAIPSNGVIFVEDDVWVEGTINTARATVASAKFPETADVKHIIVNNDLSYTNYDGQDVIALVAQGDVTVGLYSDTDLKIDAAILAKSGRAGRFFYEGDCGSNRNKNIITLYGMIGSSLRYGFAYTDDSGYNTRNIIYDANLLYGPPPEFPLASDQYQVISWREI